MRIIDVAVKLVSLNFFYLFCIRDPAHNLRQELWNKLTQIGSSRDEQLFVVGDLKELLDNTEKLGVSVRDEASFFPFRNIIQDCRLREVSSFENKFSWADERNNDWIQCFSFNILKTNFL